MFIVVVFADVFDIDLCPLRQTCPRQSLFVKVLIVVVGAQLSTFWGRTFWAPLSGAQLSGTQLSGAPLYTCMVPNFPGSVLFSSDLSLQAF